VSAHDFSRNTVAVTGAARGLGFAVAREFLGAGARVALLDIDGEGLARAAASLGPPGRALGVCVDVSDESSVAGAFAQIRAALGPVTILVNNAGVCGTEGFEELDLTAWERAIAVNLTGAFLCMKAVVPAMVERGEGGRIVNVGSLAGRSGGITVSAAYAASKAGIAGLTRAAARQLAQHRILVNCVAPSTLETDMTALWPSGRLESIRAGAPLGRLGTVEEVAAAVLFLASPGASYITGVTLDVTGGIYIAP
jgi:3-oxoacyl-[acyl-carrier protein] reductase